MISPKKEFMNRHVKPCLDIGLAVHWLKPGSKAPTLREWSTRPVATAEELKATWLPGYGLGVRVGHWSRLGDDLGLVVLDIDLRKAEASDACYEAVRSLLGHAELTVASGRALGGHIYFACPLDKLPWKANTTIGQGDGYKLELFSTGKQVVLPPSKHPETQQEYVWREGIPESLPRVPESLLSAPVVKSVPTSYKHGCRSGNGGVGRNDYLFSHDAQWLREGLDPAKLAESLHNLNRHIFEHPLGDTEVDSIVRSAIRRRQ